MPTDKTPMTQDDPHTPPSCPAPAGQDGGGNKQPGKPLPALLASLVLLAAILLAFGAGIYFLFRWLPTWEHRVLFGILVFIALMMVLMMRETNSAKKKEKKETDETIADAATRDEQQAALAHLARLPHFRTLPDGALFDYLQGSTITPCRCGKYSPLHLMVRYGKGRRHCVALVSRGALAQYLAVQDAVAAGLRQVAAQRMVQLPPNPVGGGL
jgi:hypothetical protein